MHHRAGSGLKKLIEGGGLNGATELAQRLAQRVDVGC